MKSDTNLQATPVTGFHITGVLTHGALHLQGGFTGIDGVLFARDGGAKHRHHPVAHEAANGPPVVLHRFTHALGRAIEQVVAFFRVEFLGKRR